MPFDLALTCTTGAVIGGLLLWNLLRRDFDPFAPVWLFLVGYTQVYVVQAISYREYALRARGDELVTQANLRALWALVWFLLVYYSGLGKKLARLLPNVPRAWLPGVISGFAPPLVAWGLVCAGVALREIEVSQEENIWRQFPLLMLIAGTLLLVSGRQPGSGRFVQTLSGAAVVAAYVLIWTFNARRSHALIGILVGVSAWYLPRLKRPNTLVMGLIGLACALAVSIALGWRSNARYEQSPSGFVQFLSEFDPSVMLVNMNLREADAEHNTSGEQRSKETEEYGGFLLMMRTVPELSGYDNGESYLRVFSTYIPRLLWPNKPIFGREAWINAWMAGSELKREENFTGPAIGILGAAQLNGGAVGTIIVMGLAALMLRTTYDYYRFHADTPWAQAWWSLTYYNAWLMTVNDDPMVWYYYIYGYTTLPVMAALWLFLKLFSSDRAAVV
jgi:hypothetical protein